VDVNGREGDAGPERRIRAGSSSTVAPWAQGSVEDHGRGPLVFTELGEQIAGQRNGHPELGEDLPRLPLVVRAEEGAEERDRHRLDPGRAEEGKKAAEPAPVEGPDAVPVGIDPLPDLEPELAGDDRPGAVEEEIVERGAVLAPDLQDIAEPLRRDEGRAGELSLEDGVRGHGRPVGDPTHSLRLDLPALDQLLKRGEDSLGQAVGGGGELVASTVARCLGAHRSALWPLIKLGGHPFGVRAGWGTAQPLGT